MVQGLEPWGLCQVRDRPSRAIAVLDIKPTIAMADINFGHFASAFVSDNISLAPRPSPPIRITSALNISRCECFDLRADAHSVICRGRIFLNTV